MILQAVGVRDAGLLPPNFCADSVFSIKYKFKTRQGAGALRRSELGPQEGREPRPHWASGVPRATQSGGAPQSGGGPPSSLLHAPAPHAQMCAHPARTFLLPSKVCESCRF